MDTGDEADTKMVKKQGRIKYSEAASHRKQAAMVLP
jgi:hypothetical protein